MPDKPSGSETPDNDRLDTWDEIAAFLRRDTRTVQRWERDEGLPIHRHPGRKPRVWALRSELDAWWREREARIDVTAAPQVVPEPVTPARERHWIATAILCGALAVAIGIVWYLGTQKPVPMWLPDRVFARVQAEGGHLRSISVGDYAGQLRIAPDGKRMYCLHQFRASEIVIVDLERFQVEGRIPIPGQASAMLFSPDGKALYVGTYSDGLYVVDPRSTRYTAIRDDLAGRIYDLTITADGRYLYATMRNAGLRRIDTRTRKVTRISSTGCPMFVATDRGGRYLFVSYQCGGPGSTPLHETIDILSLPEQVSVGVLRGPRMIGGPLSISPGGDQLWADGYDVCANPEYTQGDLSGCPFVPGTITNVFRISDRMLLRTLGGSKAKPLFDPAFTPDGRRAVVVGNPARVMDTEFFEEEEILHHEMVEFSSPQIDYRRQRLYLATLYPGRVYSLDLPPVDCAVAIPGLVHLWAGDGTTNDWMHALTLRRLGRTTYSPGLVGQAFRLDDGTLEAATDYESLNAVAVRDGTLAFWVKLFQANGELRVNFRWQDKSLWQLGLTNDLRLAFAQPNEPDILGISRLQAGGWHYVALVRSDNLIAVYLDGGLEIQARRPVDPRGIPLRSRILRFSGNNALVDEAALYERPLGPSDFARIMNAARGCTAGTKAKASHDGVK